MEYAEKARWEKRVPIIYESITALSCIEQIRFRAAGVLHNLSTVESFTVVHELEGAISDLGMILKEAESTMKMLSQMQAGIAKFVPHIGIVNKKIP